MAEAIPSEELRVGDVFFDPKRIPVNRAGIFSVGLRRVTATRAFHQSSVRTRVINYAVLDTVATGQLDIGAHVVVCRVEPIEKPRLLRKMVDLSDSEVVTVWAAEGRLWL